MKFKQLLFFAVAIFICKLASASNDTNQQCVGYATLDANGVIRLNLFSNDRTHGGAMLLLDKQNSLYEETLRHVGKLEKGKWKCVKPSPMKPGEEGLERKWQDPILKPQTKIDQSKVQMPAGK